MNAIESEMDTVMDNGFQVGSTFVEINLLLEARLLAALEVAAKERGLTAATITRRLIRDFLHPTAAVPPTVLSENPIRRDAAREMRLGSTDKCAMWRDCEAARERSELPRERQ